MKTQVFHEIRNGRIFLCIATPASIEEAAKLKYSAERELRSDECSPEKVRSLIAELTVETGLDLEPSKILREELAA